MVEQVLQFPYILKTAIKLPLFLAVPVIIYKYKSNLKFSVKLKKEDLKHMALWSIFVFAVIFIAYFILQSFIDVKAISDDFNNRMLLSNTTLVFAGLYTIFVNSFIEEIFFRGFIFQGLLKAGWNKRAYIYSAALFATYHVAIFKTWFNVPLTLLVLFGLFVGGIIFAHFVKKTESFLASWLIHLAADLPIVIIGFKLLGVF